MQKVNLASAYILHRHKYRETSLLLDIFSKDYGRLSLVAKGARRNRKQQGVAFEPFQRYQLSWIARSELGTLTHIDAEKAGFSLNSRQLFSGFYINELVLHLLHRHESHPELFDAYESILKQLAGGLAEEIVLRYFEKTLLQTLGYGLVLDIDVDSGEPVSPEQDYLYVYERGPVSYMKDTVEGIKISGKTLLALQQETLLDQDRSCLREAKQYLRVILARYLGDKKLASRDLYNAFIKAGTTA
ncbi:MAG: DNA repair protein RecO [Gammaproteobacteria bacterium]